MCMNANRDYVSDLGYRMNAEQIHTKTRGKQISDGIRTKPNKTLSRGLKHFISNPTPIRTAFLGNTHRLVKHVKPNFATNPSADAMESFVTL